MPQIQLGAIRDQETADSYIFLIQRGQMNHLSPNCEKEYAVVECPKTNMSVDADNNLVCTDCAKNNYSHFDSWQEAESYYLAQQNRFLTPLKVQKFNLNKWKPG